MKIVAREAAGEAGAREARKCVRDDAPAQTEIVN